MNMSLNLVLGVIFLAALTSLVVGAQQDWLWNSAHSLKGKRKPEYKLQTFLLGFYEKLIFMLIFLFCFTSGINVETIKLAIFVVGGYFTIKTLPTVWTAKLDNKDTGEDKGVKFNVYLMGNLLSVILSVISAYLLFLFSKGLFLKI